MCIFFSHKFRILYNSGILHFAFHSNFYVRVCACSCIRDIVWCDFERRLWRYPSFICGGCMSSCVAVNVCVCFCGRELAACVSTPYPCFICAMYNGNVCVCVCVCVTVDERRGSFPRIWFILFKQRETCIELEQRKSNWICIIAYRIIYTM